ncbi:RDD family protein [Geothrix sp. PMB-07]|uniref:RDD family protein n=1 Tax=Geothrix sp. PMB-07 TaxID=3068640 RepID=UPI0027416905|nr:RDD family protein [Geothrix sp. PMB-07]WLT32337.1 RDD family protein [Geothrix sp. PMB-07]
MEQFPNPYEPPSSPLVAEISSRRIPLNLVSSGTRFANAIIDGLILFAVQICFGLAVGMAFGTKGVAHLQSGCTANLYSIFFGVIYYIAMEYTFGFTVGKLITKTRVVNEFGEPPSLPQVVGRSFSRYIPFEPFSFFGSESRGWHDSLSKTFVVKREIA